jgi:hypothetical protein
MKWRKFTFGRFVTASLILILANLGVLMMYLLAGKRRCRDCSMRRAAEEYEAFVRANDIID